MKHLLGWSRATCIALSALITLNGGVALAEFSPANKCAELTNLNIRVIEGYKAHREKLLLASGVTSAAVLTGGMVYLHKSLTNVSRVLIENEVDQELLASVFNDPKSSYSTKKAALELVEKTSVNTARLSAKAEIQNTIGMRLVKGGFIGIAATAALTLFTSSTLPLHEQLNDKPMLLLFPENVPGGTRAICTAYHFQPKRMKAAEEKLKKQLAASYEMQIFVQKSVGESDANVKRISEFRETESVQDNVKVKPAVIVKPAH